MFNSYPQTVATKSTILQLKSVAVVRFMIRKPTMLAVVTSTTTPDTHNVAITTLSNPRRQNAHAPESKQFSRLGDISLNHYNEICSTFLLS